MVLEIKKAVKCLDNGGIILYPSDTLWAIGCDATNQSSIDKIYKIKKRNKSMPFICLMNNYKMVEKYTNINQSTRDIINSQKGPTTVIYDKVKNLETFSKSIGIRIPSDIFCQNLLNAFEKPIISTSVNISGDSYPFYFKEINKVILDQVDYKVNLYLDKKLDKASRIIKIREDNSIIIIRS
jgi:L-threonylcarbamoyladenylate synthase